MTEYLSKSVSVHSLTTSRMEFHYRQHGDDDGIPMLLIHGSYASGRWWEPFIELLPQEILAVALDLRGSGGSTQSPGGYEIADQALDLAAFIKELQWPEFELVAHSSGGAIAVEYVLSHPQMVRTLTLVDSVPLDGAFTPLDTYLLLDQMRTDRALLAQALQSLMPSLDLSGDDPATLDFFNMLVDDALQMAPAAFTAIADALNHWNRSGEGHLLHLPTLLLWGEQDIIVDRDDITRTLLAIPGANSLEVLRSVGHSPMIEAPQLLVDRITDFIIEDFEDFDQIKRIAIEESSGEESNGEESQADGSET